MVRKKQYRIRNWPEYNKALVNRGSLTIWFDEESIAKWHHSQPSGRRGRPQEPPDFYWKRRLYTAILLPAFNLDAQ